MHFRCEHNKDSMFAIGPCDECKNKLDNASRSTKSQEKRSDVTVHSVYRIQGHEKHMSVHVHWADELNQPLEDVHFLDEKSSGSFSLPALSETDSEDKTELCCYLCRMRGSFQARSSSERRSLRYLRDDNRKNAKLGTEISAAVSE